MRIASLVPSATDIVVSLGLGESLVGVSHGCDDPVSHGLPVLTRSRVPAAPGADPAEVDRAVSGTMAAGESLYVADRELLAALEPDVVISQSICDVCAVSGDEAHEALPPGARLVTLTATSLAGLEDDLRRVAEATGLDGQEPVGRLRRELASVTPEPPEGERPAVLALEWADPPFLGGHWVPELVERAGGRNVLAEPGRASTRATWDAIGRENVDVVVFMPCGYSLEEAVREAERLELGDAAASFWATDATRLFSRLTPAGAVGGLRTLAAILGGGPVRESDARRV